MRRGRKKKEESAPVREPVSDMETVEQEPIRESDTPRKGQEDDGPQRAPIYIVPAGSSFSCRGAVIDSKTIHRPGDEPGQIRPEYCIRGVEDLEYWFGAGKLLKK